MHIAIIGAGIAGLAAGLFLRKDGCSVTIYEKNKKLSEAGAGIQIPPNASMHFARIGLLAKIREYAFEPKSIEFCRYADSKLLQRLPGAPLVEKAFGNPYLLIHRAKYQQILYEECVAAGVEVLFDAEVEGVDQKKPAVTTKQSGERKFDLVVGADGVHSIVRSSMFVTNSAEPLITSHRAYRALIPAERMRTIPYGKRLMESGKVNNWIGPGRHIVGYPISSSFYNMVLVHPGSVRDTESWDQHGSVDQMHAMYADFDIQVRSILGLIPEVRAWKLLEMPELPRWCIPGGKVILIGDAAHAMLPYAAQGAAQCIEDAVVLNACLKSVMSSNDLDAIVKTFQRLRKPRVARVMASTRTMQNMWELPDGSLQEARDQNWKDSAEARPLAESQPSGSKSIGQVVKPGDDGSAESKALKWLWGTDVKIEAEAALSKRHASL